MSVEFKVGDLVYVPYEGPSIYQVVENINSSTYFLRVNSLTYTQKGKVTRDSFVAALFHATQENYELLSKLYPDVEFKAPELTGSALTKSMLDNGSKGVLCYVSDQSDEDAKAHMPMRIICSTTINGGFLTAANICWNYAVPVPRNKYDMDDSL